MKAPKLLILATLVLATSSWSATVEVKRSLYRNIIIDKTGSRICLRFSLRRAGGQNQSCKDEQRPDYLVFDYARLAVGAIATMHRPEKVLMIGLGGGTLAEAIHHLYPQAHVTAVEIDPAVVDVTARYFGVTNAPWLSISVMDGRVFIKRALHQPEQRYDVIVLDAFNGDYIPAHLMTVEFLQDVRRLLITDGLLIANTFATSRLYDYESATYQQVFPGFRTLNGKHSGNRIILAHKRLEKADFERAATRFRAAFQTMGIDPGYLQQTFVEKPSWTPVPRLLTDDYSPVNLLRNNR
jgi:spermidine synthase